MSYQTRATRDWGLRDTSDFLLKNPEMASSWLRQADQYMQVFADNPTGFVLPKEHAFMKPLIEAYAYDLEGFVQYLRGFRDSLAKGTGPWERLQNLYRRVMGRYTQQTRRERSDRAIAKAEELYGPTDFHTRLKWVADLEHLWAQRRLQFLAVQRATTENNRISVDEQAELLAEFWYSIDTEISEGKVPPWN